MPSHLLKLTAIVASIHGHPPRALDLWLRRSITASITTSSRFLANSSSPSAMSTRGWRLDPCASLGHRAAHDNRAFQRSRGFRGQEIVNSSEDRGGGEVLMGSENGSKDQGWTESERLHASSLSPENHHRQNASRTPLQGKGKDHSAKLLTLPTILTIGRVAAVPFLVGTFYLNNWWGTTATTGIFIAAAITDWLDGYLARKMKLGTAFGAFLDPVADKLMIAATLVLLCSRPPEAAMLGQLQWLLTIPSIAIIGREITMSAVREWAASQNSKLSEAVAVNNLGKWKTATQMTSLTILLAARNSSFLEAGILVAWGVALLYVSAGLAVWSLVVYMKKIWKVLLM